MLSRPLVVLSRRALSGGRTVVRDPRKKSKSLSVLPKEQDHPPAQAPSPPGRTPLPFEPTSQNQQSVGSSLASYALAGVGVTIGVILVRVVLGF